MPRVGFAGVLFSLSGVLWIGVGEPAHAQDRAGAAGMVAQAPPVPGPGALPPPRQPPLPPPGGGVIPPPGGVRGGGGGVVNPPLVGNLGIGAIPVMPPPPIGYYAPARTVDYNVGKFFYYPYYYYPHSYWPTESCAWPERPGQPYMRPPAYMAYPPFLEPHWRYEWATPQRYYRGFHFWLDQF
ncbi:MAG TPA: hypothetical protein VN688_32420 [Gemmataceae bacterium]|nr:hypothetical protein [Gemmataceae bacterium]